LEFLKLTCLIYHLFRLASNTAAIPVGLKTPFSFQDENKMVKSPTNEQKCPNLIDESMIFEDVFQEPDITDTLSYRPGQIPVTEFDLPEFLPNLPGKYFIIDA
jgi:hypothetical protein